MASNMYRVGDYVYFEALSTAPYQIRRIEELMKNPNGNVDAKVVCFYRRRDISSSLVLLADKHQSTLEEDSEYASSEELKPLQKHQLKHRELFLSRQLETLPATHIRGKCAVTLLNETESLQSYLKKEDSFFYTLVYDPQQKTLLADRGEIHIGNKYQAETIPTVLDEGESDGRSLGNLETLIWYPDNNLSDRQIDQFLVLARSVGTFARALDCSSSVKQPSLHMSAAAASRDVTLFHAMDVLHKNNYKLTESIAALVPSSGPILCRDEMEEWSASEANLFEEALEKYGKDFRDIRQDFLPWKSLKSLIEYYYMWKTTDRYVQQKRVKAVEAEFKLKQVYIPNYNKPNPAAIPHGKSGIMNGDMDGLTTGKPCESCYALSSSQWYAWGPSHLNLRLCQTCWSYWKKFGGLKNPSNFVDEGKMICSDHVTNVCTDGELAPMAESDGQYQCRECNKCFSRQERLTAHMASHRPFRCTTSGCGKEFKLKAHLARHCAVFHGMVVRSGSPRPVMKTRTAFYLWTTPLTRIARHVCRHILHLRHASRSPYWPINIVAVKQEFTNLVPHLNGNQSQEELMTLLRLPIHSRPTLLQVVSNLGYSLGPCPSWLAPTDKELFPKQDRVAFPALPKRKDGSLIYEPPPSVTSTINHVSPSLLKRRYEEQNGVEAPILKKSLPSSRDTNNVPLDVYPSVISHTVASHYNGKLIKSPLHERSNHQNVLSSRKQMPSWVDAPDDVYFQVTSCIRKLRNQLPVAELHRAARKPWRKLSLSPVIVLE